MFEYSGFLSRNFFEYSGNLANIFLIFTFHTDKNRTDVGGEMCDPSDVTLCATSNQDAGNVFVGLYMCIFAFILILHEMIEVIQCEGPGLLLKKNFGFLYGVHGKSAYHIFMAILPSGLKSVTLRVPCGITVGCWGIIHTLWYCKWPDHFVKHRKYNPATDD